MLALSSTIVFGECASFNIHNNTQHSVFIKRDLSDPMICSAPWLILPGQSATIEIEKTPDNTQNGAYIAFKNVNDDYELFEEFSVNHNGERAINEELISKDSAYSWSDAAANIYLCSVKQYQQHSSCDFTG